MSLLDQLRDNDLLKIHRSPDFDHFRSIERLGEARSIPIDYRGFASVFAAVSLKSCSVYLQRTFPRILQARYSTAGAMIGFAMDGPASVILNGMEAHAPTILLVKGKAVCEVIEPQANLIAFVNFESVDDRGWPGDPDQARFVAAESARFAALQATTREVLLLASNTPDILSQPDMLASVEESLLQAADHVFHTATPALETRRSSLCGYLSLLRKLDQFLTANAGRTLYSAEIAQQLGVSVRTLHNAVIAIRGMSLHRYTRLKRLWSVRQHLVQGPPVQTIKAVALVNGFWHMGEFVAHYRELFGETPQQTLAAARRFHG